MNLDDFTDPQREALLDLATLAMYADGHLAAAEDERVHRLLAALGFNADHDRSRHYDASVTRVSRHSQTAASAREYTAGLARSFTAREQRRQVLGILDDLLASDSQVAPKESSYLGIVREAFHL